MAVSVNELEKLTNINFWSSVITNAQNVLKSGLTILSTSTMLSSSDVSEDDSSGEGGAVSTSNLLAAKDSLLLGVDLLSNGSSIGQSSLPQKGITSRGDSEARN
ncbi:MAG: hypothetical protein KME13_22120 [Myxacorys californica WJT36-NPBG1]|jgi:hypothetical protein|nr:hypothetical protein [Myxacorys californica WJT36-NPBG1]